MAWLDGSGADAAPEVRADVRRIETALETLVSVLTDHEPPTHQADVGLARLHRMSGADIIAGMVTYRRDVLSGARPPRQLPEDASRRDQLHAVVDALLAGGAA